MNGWTLQKFILFKQKKYLKCPQTFRILSEDGFGRSETCDFHELLDFEPVVIEQFLIDLGG